ncbi:copper chaperone PCu(A)C [Algicola sagamiensis]|uniref:copper chaperone PCu(A)C n=1 Tax=Algicola sagamiensis TaxID=163869 RepID=UPI0012F79625|nr:copper chaperone PCu(A)C [Algicola sagamiensis]
MKIMNHFSLILSLCFSCVVFAGTQSKVDIEEFTVRAPIPGTQNTSGYLVVDNYGNQKVTIKSVSSNVADKTEIHTHVMEGDMMKMRKLDQLAVPAKSKVTFEPGGHHIMFLGLTKDISKQQSIEVIFTLQDGRQLVSQAKVVSLMPKKEHSHHHHH